MSRCTLQIIFIFFGLYLSPSHLFSQLDFSVACRTARPLCSADQVPLPPFMNITGEDISFQGLACLNSTQNNSWVYIRIQEPGDLIFNISQWVDVNGNELVDRNEERLDVDFIAWGPFETSTVNCEENLARGCDNNGDGEGLRPEECQNNADAPDYYIENMDNTNIVDCSFGRQSVELLTIPDAIKDQYYLILITNFSDRSGVFTMEQTNIGEPGAGLTDCSILDPGVGDDIATCGAFPITLEGRFPTAISYQWRTAPLETTNFTNIGGVSLEASLEVNSQGVYELIGYSDEAGTIEVGRDDLNVIDVSTIQITATSSFEQESFAENYTVTSSITTAPVDIQELGLRDFEYRLDRDIGNGYEEYRPYQSDSIFTGLPAGDYQVFARYENCPQIETAALEEIFILGYPQFFSPNGDGQNDTWTIINSDLLTQPATIYIFDRSGKLLKQIVPGGIGWDGTYNGRQMPSSSYWFRAEFNEPTDPDMRRRVVQGSFALIR